MSWPTDEMVEAAVRTHYRDVWSQMTDDHRTTARTGMRENLTAALAAAPREWGYRSGSDVEPTVTKDQAQRQVSAFFRSLGQPDPTTHLVSRTAPGPWGPSPSDEQETQS